MDRQGNRIIASPSEAYAIYQLTNDKSESIGAMARVGVERWLHDQLDITISDEAIDSFATKMPFLTYDVSDPKDRERYTFHLVTLHWMRASIDHPELIHEPIIPLELNQKQLLEIRGLALIALEHAQADAVNEGGDTLIIQGIIGARSLDERALPVDVDRDEAEEHEIIALLFELQLEQAQILGSLVSGIDQITGPPDAAVDE